MEQQFKLKLELDLSRHCLLTELKRRYERALAEALRLPEAGTAAATLEFVKAVLEEVDLEGLRGRIPELGGGSQAGILLVQTGRREAVLFVNGREVFRHSLV